MTVKQIHVEASTYCNARCPLCPRNHYGYNVTGVYPELNLSVEKFKHCLSDFPNRELVLFNGNLGDPMMNPDILRLAQLVGCETQVTTNGSIGNSMTWKGLARLGVEVIFSVDGLEDTNHLYRQDVLWTKVIERMNWFIQAGGNAIWKFVVFKHNSHQKEKAKELSRDLGFQNFWLVDHGRNYGPVLDKKARVTHWILPEDGSKVPESCYDVKAGIERYKKTHNNFKPEQKKYDISCEHLEKASVFIDARGRVSPCCYQGFDLPDRPFRELQEFNNLRKTWETTECDRVCAESCGSKKMFRTFSH